MMVPRNTKFTNRIWKNKVPRQSRNSYNDKKEEKKKITKRRKKDVTSLRIFFNK